MNKVPPLPLVQVHGTCPAPKIPAFLALLKRALIWSSAYFSDQFCPALKIRLKVTLKKNLLVSTNAEDCLDIELLWSLTYGNLAFLPGMDLAKGVFFLPFVFKKQMIFFFFFIAE